jgi:valyl-tRNA synthetase
LICAGLFDAEKELLRLEKQKEKMEAELATAEARLSNTKFTSKAPESVVAQFRNQKENAEQKLKMIAEKSSQMRACL